MKTGTVLLVCALVLSGAATAKTRPIPDRCSPGSDDTHYFPQVSFWSDDLGDSSTQPRALSEYLAAMNEPPLGCAIDRDVDSFRLLWVGDHPLSIRITRRDNVHELKLVELDSGNLQAPGKILRSFTKTINTAEWKQAVAALSGVPLMFPNHINIGATAWVLEGVYHRHYTMGWGENPGLGAVGQLFMQLAGYTGPADKITKSLAP